MIVEEHIVRLLNYERHKDELRDGEYKLVGDIALAVCLLPDYELVRKEDAGSECSC